MRKTITIEKAKLSDAEGIFAVIHHYAKQNTLLPRSLSEIYANIRSFFVAKRNGVVIGTCALSIHWKDFAEIRSLAVLPPFKRRGIGTQLLRAALREARRMGITKVFTLTRSPAFFQKNGFTVIDKSVLPIKVWADCFKCPKFQNCDEIPMLITTSKVKGER